MLLERYRELLTAYVDGELSARQRRHVLRLLQRSVEARRLVERLQSDARALRDLPRPRLDRDLSGPVLQKIAAARPIPMRRARRFTAAPAYPAWAGAAAAAAVLFVVGTASYCYFVALDRTAGPVVAVVRNPINPPLVAPEVKPPAASNTVAQTPRPDPEEKTLPAPAPPLPADDVAHQKPADPNPPAVPEKDEPIYTSPSMEMFTELKAVAPNRDLPTAFKLHELDQDAVHKKLLDELQKGAALRLELPVPDGTRAFERLQGVLKARHIDLTIDASAQRRLSKPQMRTNYVLYSEDLTADELAPLLQQLGADDKKEKHPADNLFEALVVRGLTESDHKELSALLGVDPVLSQPAKETGPLGVDPHKPLSDQTAAQLAAALAGPGKAGSKPTIDRIVLALPYNPVRPKHDSAEIKRFLDERKPLRAGALQVLLVLRGPTG